MQINLLAIHSPLKQNTNNMSQLRGLHCYRGTNSLVLIVAQEDI